MDIPIYSRLHKKWILILIGILFSIAGISFADVVIIVHPENDSVFKPEDIKQIFLKKTKKFPNGMKATPLNQRSSSDIRKIIIMQLLRKLPRQDKAYWANYQFSGKGRPPRVVRGGEEVLALVAKEKSCIGYINSELLNHSVKVVYTIKNRQIL